MSYWRRVAKRAAAEALAMTPWASPSKAVFSLVPTLVAAVAGWLTTRNPFQTGVITIATVVLLALGAFIWRCFAVPVAMDAEAAADIQRLQPLPGPDQITMEQERRSQLIEDLTRLYSFSGRGLTPGFMAGLELPPADWLNAQLEERGEPWRVLRTDRLQFWSH